MKFDRKLKGRFGKFGPFAVIAAFAGVALAGCGEDPSGSSPTRAYRPLSSEMLALMQEKGVAQNSPVLIRAYKKEAELEIWKMAPDGRYVLLKTYPMCRWSGQLGPKTREGDRQVPEGFYAITPGQMNPNSNYYLSFNVGYPNAYDRAHNYTGGSIMVHGACSSAGCFSMTDQEIAEIYAVAREALLGGQRAIQMQSLPFHMTAENFAKYRLDPNINFWKELKVGTDNFEVTRQDVAVGVCNSRYVFNAKPAEGTQLDPMGPCPPMKQDEQVKAEVAAKERRDDAKVAQLAASGMRAVHTVYADGGQNASFASTYIPGLSRPEALAQGPVDVVIEDKTKKFSPVAQQANAKPKAKTIVTPATPEPVAVAAAPQPEPQAPPPQQQPQNAVSLLANIWGGQKNNNNPQPVANTAATSDSLATASTPMTPQPANVPLPPRRFQTAMKPATVDEPQ